jgi:hypothetical protein
MQRKPMHMKNWINKLHGFLTLNEREILDHKGSISHDQAEQHALNEFKNSPCNFRVPNWMHYIRS